jgi:signal transduction histidine kinase
MRSRSHFAKRSLTDERLERLIAAEQDERRRIALFLHDGPVQNLAGIALMLDAVLYSLETGKPEDARDVLAAALDRQRETIRELRNLSFALEPVVLRDQGFGPAVQALASQVGTAHELRIDLDVESTERLGETAQVALYTIVRELLDQAVRRGPPSRVEVSLRPTQEGGVELTVLDDAEPERRLRALEGVEERVAQLHGAIAVERGPGGGTRIVVTLPPYATRR